jgi:hypothetical protein
MTTRKRRPSTVTVTCPHRLTAEEVARGAPFQGEEVGDTCGAEVDVQYLDDPGDRGDYWTPPTPPGVELVEPTGGLRCYQGHAFDASELERLTQDLLDRLAEDARNAREYGRDDG